MTLARSIYVAATFSLAIAACGGEAGTNQPAEEHGGSDEAALLTDTVVHVEANGSQRVEIFTHAARISGEGSASETAYRFRPRLCALIAYDQLGGAGNSLCLSASRDADVTVVLSSYPYGTNGETWSGRIRSFVAIEQGISGSFWAWSVDDDSGPPSTVEPCKNGFYSGEALTNVDGCQGRAIEVRLVHDTP